LPFAGTRAGDYVVTLTATAGAHSQTVRLTSRRL
jgi:hypothetical protein